MMSLIVLTILVAAAGTASVMLDRRWRAQRALQETTPAADASTSATTSAVEASDATVISKVTDRVAAVLRSVPMVGDRLAMVGDRLSRKKDPNLPGQFREWIAKAFADDPSVNNWVQGLSQEGLQAFTDHLSVFCSEMGFELAWVVQQQLETQPELAQTFAQVVSHYCRACHQAAATQDDLEVYKTLQAFERNPASRKTQAFGQKLFAKVVEAGLTSVSMPEYLISAPKEQQQYMVRAIREAAKTNHAVFNRLLKEVVRDSAPGSTAAQPATTQARTSTDQGADAPVTSFA
jgi:hypothetical protein